VRTAVICFFDFLLFVEEILFVHNGRSPSVTRVAELSQVAKTVDTSIMVVAPLKTQCIATHYADISDGCRVGNGFGPQRSLTGPFVNALRARTSTTQLSSVIGAAMFISPEDT
jgi:hypothetical protein